ARERRRAGDLLPGRRVEVLGRLHAPRENALPFGFDRAARLLRDGDSAVLEVETAWRLAGDAKGPASLLARIERRARGAIRASRPGAGRATAGMLVFVLGGAFGRGGDAWNRLAVSLLVMLGWDPGSLEDAGFQLSFGTVALLLAVARPIEELVAGPRRRR